MMADAAILWKDQPSNVEIGVERGELVGEASSDLRLDFTINAANLDMGSEPTRVLVRWEEHAFTFFLRDLGSECPIFIPAYGVAVVPRDDLRTYCDVERDVRARGLLTNLQRIDVGARATKVTGGDYNAERESVLVTGFTGYAKVLATF